MNQLETYHKLREMQRKIKHLRDFNTAGFNRYVSRCDYSDAPVVRDVALAYDNAYNMVDKLANKLYRDGITQEEPEV